MSKKTPDYLLIRFDRNFSPVQIKEELIRVTKEITEKNIPPKTANIKVYITGFERDCRHPAILKSAKRKYEEVIEAGLAGLVSIYGSDKDLQELYCTAYAKAKIKGDKLKFKGINEKSFMEKINKVHKKSCEEYLSLIDQKK